MEKFYLRFRFKKSTGAVLFKTSHSEFGNKQKFPWSAYRSRFVPSPQVFLG